MKRITIIGSIPGDLKSREEFQNACRAIGRELARKRVYFLVGSDEPNTADEYVVEGAIQWMKDKWKLRKGLIHAIEREDGAIPFSNRTSDREVFQRHPRKAFMGSEKIVAVQESDAVLAIGGGPKTYNAGLAAIVAEKRLVPISVFGGTSKDLLAALENFGNPLLREQIDQLCKSNVWTDDIARKALKLCGIRRPRVLLIHGHADDWRQVNQWVKHTRAAKPIALLNTFRPGDVLAHKFEDLASRVDGAIALVTPDDIGAAVSDDRRRSRARQNVWLEYGWFWGKLGRERVMMLVRGDVETPSDLSGVLSVEYVDGPLERQAELMAFCDKLRRGTRSR